MLSISLFTVDQESVYDSAYVGHQYLFLGSRLVKGLTQSVTRLTLEKDRCAIS